MRQEELREALRDSFQWRGSGSDGMGGFADITAWWRDREILRELGPAVADVAGGSPSVVMAPESRGTLLGALVALHLDVGLVELRKDPDPAADSDAWRVRTTPPDYRNLHLRLGFRRDLVRSGDRVLFVDDWIATGGQALTARLLVEDAGAEWVGAVVLVDALEFANRRRDLGLKGVLHVRDL